MHEARLAEAQENVERLKEEVSVRIGQSYNRVERTKKMLEVAAEVVTLRTEGERIAENQLTQGVVLFSARRQAAKHVRNRFLAYQPRDSIIRVGCHLMLPGSSCFSRKSLMLRAISSRWVSSAKWPVGNNRTSASGRSR